MPSRRGTSNPSIQRFRSSKCRLPAASLLLLSVITPLVFLAGRAGNFRSAFGHKDISDGVFSIAGDQRKLSALEQIETLFPKEVIDVIDSHTDDSGPLSLNIVGRKDLSSSWVLEKPVNVREGISDLQTNRTTVNKGAISKDGGSLASKAEIRTAFEEQAAPVTMQLANAAQKELVSEAVNQENGVNITGILLTDNTPTDDDYSTRIARRQMRMERKEKRLMELTQQNKVEATKLEKEAIVQSKEIDGGILSKYSIWRRENEENSDSLVRLMRDQVIMARVYASLAQARDDQDLVSELRQRIKESQRALGEATVDSDLPHSASEKVKLIGQVLSKARGEFHDCTAITKKLRAMLQSAEEQTHVHKKQSTFLSQLAAKTLPKGLHCLSMRLTIEYSMLPEDQREFPGQENIEDPSLFHYALFSDNVIAASAVINSTICNANEPEKHVFHLVTDKLNFGAMKMWFLTNPPGNATIHIQNIDDFKWLNSSYCPVLRQLESAAMKQYYFKADQPTTLADGASNLKYRNPKYLSMLNHLRFYLPEVYPKLDKILFLDDDIVVQKDLTPLWSVDLHGNVNGAVETCGETFHRFDTYLNFSNPLISRNFDRNACGWAYGMNIFDLQTWKKLDITGIYHKWQNMNVDRELWKLGTLPPGLITFYNLTHPLEKSWHVLGLGYNPSVELDEIEGAAVVHYNGNMKPWLDLAMNKYKPYWTKYVNYDDLFLQQCNVNP